MALLLSYTFQNSDLSRFYLKNPFLRIPPTIPKRVPEVDSQNVFDDVDNDRSRLNIFFKKCSVIMNPIVLLELKFAKLCSLYDEKLHVQWYPVEQTQSVRSMEGSYNELFVLRGITVFRKGSLLRQDFRA